jgi:predicted lipid carrier protein YhbT
MTDSTPAFFDELGRRGHEPLLEKANGTVRFDLVGDSRTERWLVTLDRGDVFVSRKNVAADCVVRAERTLFDAIVSGKVNAMAAYLRGELTLEGDPELLVLFQRVLPGPATRRRSARRGRDRQ